MPVFLYKAVDPAGKSARGQMEAFNDVDLELRLKRMGLDLVTFRSAKKQQSLFGGLSVSLQDLIMFCFQMEQLTRAGVPVLEGLADLRDSTPNPAFREIIGQLVSAVEGGLLISQAMAQHPKIFNNVFVSLVKAGEQTGKLAEVFDNLASTLKWQDELMAQTKRLLAYPLFVMVVVLGATAFLMTYLVPQMVGFLKNMGQEVPLQTKIMIAVSNAMVQWWWLFLTIPVLAFIGVSIAIKQNPEARYRFDYLKLHLPITGIVMQKILMARFARYFALMYQTGIPILDAIKTCQDIVDNRVVADGLERAHQQINAGESMSESFHNLGLFPPLVVRMIRVGEGTGALDAALLNISYFYDRDVKDAVEKMLKMLEPTLTIVLGALLAMIMFSVLGPVYDSLSKMKF
ncbi:MAG TPA: type II secretion system F family protein [Novimethylophilus sp.]|jgi:type IV pilus assembly protein PilC|uniref:type II secretion system F family protein n=1 Tax=Novimethylophilus sp. TaxID=2137426 RepID=UPI002F401992